MAETFQYRAPLTGSWAPTKGNIFKAYRKGGRYHSGNDLRAKNGSKVGAIVGGTVVYTGDNRGYQHNAVVIGDDGHAIRYATHGPLNVRFGQRVEPGQIIGTIGRGHLHMEVMPPGSPALARQMEAFQAGKNSFVSTSWYPGQQPKTIDPSEYFGVPPGTNIELGSALSGAPAVPRVAPTPPGAVGGIGTRRLKQGRQGEDVQALNQTLAALGYNADPNSDTYDKQTVDAVKAYQGDLNRVRAAAGAEPLKVDGIVGSETRAHIAPQYEHLQASQVALKDYGGPASGLPTDPVSLDTVRPVGNMLASAAPTTPVESAPLRGLPPGWAPQDAPRPPQRLAAPVTPVERRSLPDITPQAGPVPRMRPELNAPRTLSRLDREAAARDMIQRAAQSGIGPLAGSASSQGIGGDPALDRIGAPPALRREPTMRDVRRHQIGVDPQNLPVNAGTGGGVFAPPVTSRGTPAPPRSPDFDFAVGASNAPVRSAGDLFDRPAAAASAQPQRQEWRDWMQTVSARQSPSYIANPPGSPNAQSIRARQDPSYIARPQGTGGPPRQMTTAQRQTELQNVMGNRAGARAGQAMARGSPNYPTVAPPTPRMRPSVQPISVSGSQQRSVPAQAPVGFQPVTTVQRQPAVSPSRAGTLANPSRRDMVFGPPHPSTLAAASPQQQQISFPGATGRGPVTVAPTSPPRPAPAASRLPALPSRTIGYAPGAAPGSWAATNPGGVPTNATDLAAWGAGNALNAGTFQPTDPITGAAASAIPGEVISPEPGLYGVPPKKNPKIPPALKGAMLGGKVLGPAGMVAGAIVGSLVSAGRGGFDKGTFTGNQFSGFENKSRTGLSNATTSSRPPSGNFSGMTRGSDRHGRSVSEYTDSRGRTHRTTRIGGRDFYSRGR